jgi:lipoprotein-anchoring transpeptidase ErfK/SrfK
VRGRAGVLLAIPLLAAACGTQTDRGRVATHGRAADRAAAVTVQGARACSTDLRALGSNRTAYVGVAPQGAVALQDPGGAVLARFGPKNVNNYPTLFGIVGVVDDRDCAPLWYRVQLPIRPNGITGYVAASSLGVLTVSARIVIDISARSLTLFEHGKVRLTATVAVGSPATPTPTGSYYVNQRLIPTEPNGPFGPGAIGISAFSNVLTGWAQGGPIAIHGTNAPWSIGKAVSNGCIRLPNATLRTVFRAAIAGTPVVIRA